MQPLTLHPDRLLPRDPATRELARQLNAQVEKLPIISPHGHTDPRWFAQNAAFTDATDLLLRPDHFRPDPVLDPEFEGFVDNLRTLSAMTAEDCFSYQGYNLAKRAYKL